MNTKFYSLRRGLSESVGLYVRMEDMNDPDDRVRIMRIRDEYDRDPEGFINNCREKDTEIKSLIEEARHRLADIRTDDEILMKISRRCLDENVQGHTADIVMKECAMAVAALHGREKIEDEDLEEAAYFVFPHRRRMSGDSEQPGSSEEGEKTEEEEGSGDENEEASGSNDDQKQEASHSGEGGEGDHAGEGRSSGSKNHAAGDAFDVIDLSHIADRKRRNLNGRRTESRTGKNSGRYIYSTIQRTNKDIALDATLRAAEPFQLKRKKNGMAVSIRDDDIREKVRQKKVANLFVFVVDAS